MDAFAEPKPDGGLAESRSNADADKEVRYRALIETGLDQANRGETIRVDDPRAWLAGRGRRPA